MRSCEIIWKINNLEINLAVTPPLGAHKAASEMSCSVLDLPSQEVNH